MRRRRPTTSGFLDRRWFFLFVILAIACRGFAQSERYAVLASAVVQESPPQIVFTWPLDAGTPGFPVLGYEVFRKARGDSSWGAAMATLAGDATGFTDTNVAVGGTYEYEFVKHATNLTGYGYLWSGIRAPLMDDRGKLVLLVDDTYAAALAPELSRLQQDLAGDGWTVLRHDVSRTGSVVEVRELIRGDWLREAGVRAVFLFGHVPVPYAGNITPDEHPDHHKGAWPADVYYGELDGRWTDFFVNNSTADSPRNWNTPGDGKFDQSVLPSDVELQLGRVDLANLPGRESFGGPPTLPEERELLRQFLNKDHNYRHKLFNLARRGLIHDGAGGRDGAAGAATGWRACAAFFGVTNTEVDLDETFLVRVSTNSYLWSYVSDAGDYNSMGRVGGSGNFGSMLTPEMVSSYMQTAFVAFLGSWLGDWDSEDNLMRGVLAGPSYGLACVYGGVPHWFFHHLGLGENIGYSTRLTQNNYPSFYKNQISPSPRSVHVSLMGDPTLRLFMLAPPGQLTTLGSSNVVLNWNPSPDAALGYHVYRSTSVSGYFTRLTAEPVAGTNFTDFAAARGTNIYMVRAVNLETSASGSYTNASQGVFAAASVTEGPLPTPVFSSLFLRDAQFHAKVLANAGLHYELQATTNFVDWEVVARLVATASPFELVDTNATNFNERYYRVSTGP